MRRFLLRQIARLTVKAPILVLSACALVTVVAGVRALYWETTRLFPLETDVLTLLPDTAREAQRFRRSLAEFGSFDYLLAVVECSEPHQEDLLTSVATHFARAERYSRYIEPIEFAPAAQEAEVGVYEVDERQIPGIRISSDGCCIVCGFWPCPSRPPTARLFSPTRLGWGRSCAAIGFISRDQSRGTAAEAWRSPRTGRCC